jgi:hypothetical protein
LQAATANKHDRHRRHRSDGAKALEEKAAPGEDGLEEQVAERTKELRESEARLFGILEHSAADLKAMRRLNEIGTRCAKEGDDMPVV